MTLNLNDEWISLDPTSWSALQTEVSMNVAMAKLDCFVSESHRMADFVRLGLISRATAADYLHIAATYNQLTYEYGHNHIEEIIASAFQEAA